MLKTFSLVMMVALAGCGLTLLTPGASADVCAGDTACGDCSSDSLDVHWGTDHGTPCVTIPTNVVAFITKYISG